MYVYIYRYVCIYVYMYVCTYVRMYVFRLVLWETWGMCPGLQKLPQEGGHHGHLELESLVKAWVLLKGFRV